MKVGCPKEMVAGEQRVAMTPDSVRQIQKLGYDCLVQSGAKPPGSMTPPMKRPALLS